MSLKAKICAILFGMACAVSGAQAQDMKGTTEPMKPANWLFVQVADSVTVSDKTLTLKGVAPQTLMFADRPERMTGDTPPPSSPSSGMPARTASSAIRRTPPSPSRWMASRSLPWSSSPIRC